MKINYLGVFPVEQHITMLVMPPQQSKQLRISASRSKPPLKALNQRQQRWSDGGEGLSLGENNNPRLRANGPTTQAMLPTIDYR